MILLFLATIIRSHVIMPLTKIAVCKWCSTLVTTRSRHWQNTGWLIQNDDVIVNIYWLQVLWLYWWRLDKAWKGLILSSLLCSIDRCKISFGRCNIWKWGIVIKREAKPMAIVLIIQHTRIALTRQHSILWLSQQHPSIWDADWLFCAFWTCTCMQYAAWIGCDHVAWMLEWWT